MIFWIITHTSHNFELHLE